jgi:hypothetical protein
MMGCLFGCFRASGDGGDAKGAVDRNTSLAPATTTTIQQVGLLAP